MLLPQLPLRAPRQGRPRTRGDAPHSLNAIVESALADPDDFRALSEAYRRSRHRIEVVALATPEVLSQLGTIDRFLTEASVGAGGRFVTWANHDACTKNMHTTLAVIEAEQLADRVTVVSRDGTVLDDNELVDGAWRRRPAADKAVARGRSRTWTARETVVFQQEIARAEVGVHRDVPSEDERLAVVIDGAQHTRRRWRGLVTARHDALRTSP
ncbi:putative DNA-binding protein (plasmid) [Streptomyces sp. GBA 94-10 4N24]|uniref:zeta toxin family protein n=1 Tax=Streptomyces sp. GBA 94-10 4N24 TaxID=1218177 RepID=UPI0003C30B6B|nr:zeta toxin family protein [Streptomyces sp. GBA 94-10 4N24]ESP95694.1 putative DNA-binding protein [Streptomyces sp. GBA 94-10 4N24]UZN63154.1 putative DNA-binding protein [Streptomyces sp. GBA 94-10 4N24]